MQNKIKGARVVEFMHQLFVGLTVGAFLLFIPIRESILAENNGVAVKQAIRRNTNGTGEIENTKTDGVEKFSMWLSAQLLSQGPGDID